MIIHALKKIGMRQLLSVSLFICQVLVTSVATAQNNQPNNPNIHSLATNNNASSIHHHVGSASCFTQQYALEVKPTENNTSYCQSPIQHSISNKLKVLLNGYDDFYEIDYLYLNPTVIVADMICVSAPFIQHDFVQWLLNCEEDMDVESAKVVITKLYNGVKNKNGNTCINVVFDDYESYLDYLDTCNLALAQNTMVATKTN